MHGYLKNNLTTKGSLFLILFVIHISLFAQTTLSTKTIITENDTIVLQAVPISSLTKNIENVEKEIETIKRDIKPSEKFLSVDSLYFIAYENLSEENKEVSDSENKTSDRILRDALQQWLTYKTKLEEWQVLLRDRSSLISDKKVTTKNLIIVWELTLIDAQKEQVPKGIELNIRDVINKLTALKNKLKEDGLDVYSKQSKLSDIAKLIDQTIATIEEQKKAQSKDLLIQDSPAIWNSIDSTFSSSFNADAIKKSTDEVKKSIMVFYISSKDRFYSHILIIIILIVLFKFIYKQSFVSENEDKQFLFAKKILSLPILSALMLGFLITLLLYPLRQLIIDEILQFIMLVLISVYLPKVMDKKYSTVIFLSIALHLINQIHLIYFTTGLILRVLIFIEIGFSFYILKLLLNKQGHFRSKVDLGKWSFLVSLLKLFQISLIIPLLANILGFVELAIYINNFIVNSLISGFITIVSFVIFISAIVLIFNSKYILVFYSVRNNSDKIIKWFIKYSSILAFLLWLSTAFQLLGIYDTVLKGVFGIFDINWEIGDVDIDMGSVLKFILIIYLTYLVTKFVKLILEEEVFTRIKLPRGVPGATSMLVGYFIVGWGMIISITALGINLSEFGLLAGALGVGIGFGLQSIVLNFIAGLVLAFERPIQAGDTIEVGTVMGTVKSIGVRASTVLTFDGSEVIVPNGSLISNDVVNWTLSDRRKRRDIMVGVEYGTDPHLVMDILREAAKNNINVLQDPEPWILFDGFGDSSLNFMLRFWSPMDVGLTTKSEVTIAIYDGLNKAGIVIPFPQQDLHVKSIEPEVERIILEKKKASVSNKIKKDS